MPVSCVRPIHCLSLSQAPRTTVPGSRTAALAIDRPDATRAQPVRNSIMASIAVWAFLIYPDATFATTPNSRSDRGTELRRFSFPPSLPLSTARSHPAFSVGQSPCGSRTDVVMADREAGRDDGDDNAAHRWRAQCRNAEDAITPDGWHVSNSRRSPLFCTSAVTRAQAQTAGDRAADNKLVPTTKASRPSQRSWRYRPRRARYWSSLTVAHRLAICPPATITT